MAIDTFFYLASITDNKPAGTRLTREQLIKGAAAFTGSDNYLALMDRIGYFVGLAILKADITNENFVILRKPTPEEIKVVPPIGTAAFMASDKTLHRLAEEVSETQLCSDTLFNLDMSVMEISSLCKFTYPQGSILKYTMQYLADFNYVHKIRQTAQYAQLYNYAGPAIATMLAERTLYDFVGANDLNSVQIAILRHTLANKYSSIIKICDKLIYDKNELECLS